MTKPIIEIVNLAKSYKIGSQKQSYVSIREEITKWLSFSSRHKKNKTETFWALKNLCLNIYEGEVVGVIGRNGAGKSTLLKVISQITPPTQGFVKMRGRVSSLLEVGTGFHPELTGRENIYLNGAIIGMTRKEIKRKFDEIVAFADVEEFLETPVKRYSSGMYVRLAFAVAAHLEPEILLVDEVLAVGDADFQKKCLGKMTEVAKGGRTVMFVSHNMQAIKSLCTRAILLDRGSLQLDTDSGTAVQEYLSGIEGSQDSFKEWLAEIDRPGDEYIHLLSVRVKSGELSVSDSYASSDPIIVDLEFDVHRLHSALTIGFQLVTSTGVVVLSSYHNDDEENKWPQIRLGRNILRCIIPPGLLYTGGYGISPKISLHCIKWIANLDPVVRFRVELTHGKSPFWSALTAGNRAGIISPIFAWTRVEEQI